MTTSKLAGSVFDAPDRCMPRRRRLLTVKFVALPGLPVVDKPRFGISLLINRVLGFLAVARR